MKTFKGVFANKYMGESVAEYSGSKGYSFKTLLDIQVDDEVLVECAAGLAVVKVASIDDVISDKTIQWAFAKATQWAFAKVDREVLQKLKDKDTARASLTRQLDVKLRARKETSKYMDLAKEDKEAASLLEQLQALD